MNSLWWKRAVFYEVYVDKFAGDFRSFAERLPYLKELGINCIHILPHYPSPMIDDGYDVSDYLNVRQCLGTLEDFSVFVKKAHNIEMRIMIDFVLNHTSVEHPWFKEARSSENNPKRDYYLWSKNGAEFPDAVNPFADLKPKNWTYNPQTSDYYFSTFYPEQADLNWDNPEVFEEMMRVLDFWKNLGVDGFRLDAASHLIKREGTNSKNLPATHTILKKIRAYLDRYHKETALIAEASGPIEKIREYFGDGDECELAYHFPLVEQIFLALKRNDPSLIQKAIEGSCCIPKNCDWAVFLRHHDEMSLPTLDSKERAELANFFDPEKKYRFAGGIAMRLADLLHGDKEKIIKAFKMLLSLPAAPIIYYGDEIGMRNTPIPTGEKDKRKALRGVFDWKLAEAERKKPDSIFAAISALIKKRRGNNQG